MIRCLHCVATADAITHATSPAPTLYSRSARGDLARLLGMRTVAFLGLVSEINADVGLSGKAKVVGGICFSKAMFWDSKYHVSQSGECHETETCWLLSFLCWFVSPEKKNQQPPSSDTWMRWLSEGLAAARQWLSVVGDSGSFGTGIQVSIYRVLVYRVRGASRQPSPTTTSSVAAVLILGHSSTQGTGHWPRLIMVVVVAAHRPEEDTWSNALNG